MSLILCTIQVTGNYCGLFKHNLISNYILKENSKKHKVYIFIYLFYFLFFGEKMQTLNNVFRCTCTNQTIQRLIAGNIHF